jgi:hypothetical protein
MDPPGDLHEGIEKAMVKTLAIRIGAIAGKKDSVPLIAGRRVSLTRSFELQLEST